MSRYRLLLAASTNGEICRSTTIRHSLPNAGDSPLTASRGRGDAILDMFITPKGRGTWMGMSADTMTTLQETEIGEFHAVSLCLSPRLNLRDHPEFNFWSYLLTLPYHFLRIRTDHIMKLL